MYDIAAVGELLVDFIGQGETGRGTMNFEANPGGAPCNVLAMAARQGKQTAFLGKVGDDLFGRFLARTLDEVGIDRTGLVLDPEAATTLAFVSNGPEGEREFRFYRDPGADELLRADELAEEVLRSARIVHFGSLSLTREPVRTATRRAVETARAAGAWLSFDPNLRPALWDSLDRAREEMLWGCGVCDSAKVAVEELTFLTGTADPAAGAAELLRQCPQMKLLTVTHGAGGSEAYAGGCHAFRPACPVRAVDTTGAGDAFCGGCLCWLLDHGMELAGPEELAAMLETANAGAALVAARYGAIRSMPGPEEIRALLN